MGVRQKGRSPESHPPAALCPRAAPESAQRNGAGVGGRGSEEPGRKLRCRDAMSYGSCAKSWRKAWQTEDAASKLGFKEQGQAWEMPGGSTRWGGQRKAARLRHHRHHFLLLLSRGAQGVRTGTPWVKPHRSGCGQRCHRL